MVELKLGLRTVDLPYTVHIQDVTEEMFDELVDEDTRAELLDGVMIVHSPASPRHDDVAGFTRSLMRCYAEEIELGKVFGPDSLVHLATCRKFAPDLFLFLEDHVPFPLPKKQFEGSPDLVGEVLSPSNGEDDMQRKRPAYRQARIPEIWLIDPEARTVTVDRLVRGRYQTQSVQEGKIESRVLKGFWLEAGWLWREPLPKVMTCLSQLLRGKPR